MNVCMELHQYCLTVRLSKRTPDALRLFAKFHDLSKFSLDNAFFLSRRIISCLMAY